MTNDEYVYRYQFFRLNNMIDEFHRFI